MVVVGDACGDTVSWSCWVEGVRSADGIRAFARRTGRR